MVTRKEDTPARLAKRRYEERNKEKRQEKSGNFQTMLPRELLNEINLQEDSLRIYLLGNHWHGHKEHFGTKKTFDIAEDVLLI